MIVPSLSFALPLAVWNLTAFFRQCRSSSSRPPWSTAAPGAGVPQGHPSARRAGRVHHRDHHLHRGLERVHDRAVAWSTRRRSRPPRWRSPSSPAPPDRGSRSATQMAAGVIVTVPLVIVVLIFQRRIVAGLTAGGEQMSRRSPVRRQGKDDAQRRTPRPGGAAPSSTRSTSAASPTATATASVTSPASGRGCPTCATSASTRSGSRRSTPRRWPTAGYDVADYRDIEPLFGTLADADGPASREAHELGLRVIIDIVPNHSSDQHALVPGGPRGRAGQPGARAVHLPARPRARTASCRRTTGESAFGGPAWTRLPDGEWYLHLFAPEQPDFNWENPEVVAEFEDILRFWLDRGVDGFRIDVANALKKDQGLPDVGPRPRRRPRAAPSAAPPVLGPRRGARGLPRLAQGRRRATTATATFVAEAWVDDPDRLARYVRAGRAAHGVQLRLPARPVGRRTSCARRSTSSLRRRRRGRRARDLGAVQPRRHPARHPLRPAATTPSGGVDRRRRVRPDTPLDPALGLRRARAAALLMLALPGSAYVYQGEELGLPEVVDLPEDVARRPDLGALRAHASAAGTAAGCRSRGPATARRSASARTRRRPGCPQPAAWRTSPREAQNGVPGSTLELYRAALRLRREHPALGEGTLRWLEAPEGVLLFSRDAGLRLRGQPLRRARPLPDHTRGPARQRPARRRRAPARHRRLAGRRRLTGGRPSVPRGTSMEASRCQDALRLSRSRSSSIARHRRACTPCRARAAGPAEVRVS